MLSGCRVIMVVVVVGLSGCCNVVKVVVVVRLSTLTGYRVVGYVKWGF